MHGATVLVVEDNRDILEAVRLLLENGGFTVILAEDCRTALDYLARCNADAILTDLRLPEMTGLEFIHQVRRVLNFDRIPIIAMSAYGNTFLSAAVAAGADAALRKPDDLDGLVEKIQEIIARRLGRLTAQG